MQLQMQDIDSSIKRKIINPTQMAMTASTILQRLHGIVSVIMPVLQWILLNIIYVCYFFYHVVLYNRETWVGYQFLFIQYTFTSLRSYFHVNKIKLQQSYSSTIKIIIDSALWTAEENDDGSKQTCVFKKIKSICISSFEIGFISKITNVHLDEGARTIRNEC